MKNALTILTHSDGEIRGVRVNGQEIDCARIDFSADAEDGRAYRVVLEFRAEALYTESGAPATPPEPQPAPRARYLGDDTPTEA